MKVDISSFYLFIFFTFFFTSAFHFKMNYYVECDPVTIPLGNELAVNFASYVCFALRIILFEIYCYEWIFFSTPPLEYWNRLKIDTHSLE